jgi:hypothetical protein
MATTEGAGRKRRRRRGRRGGGRGSAAAPASQPDRAAPEWQWRTFPVFFAFSIGLVVMGLFVNTQIALAVFIAGLFGLAFGIAHIATRAITTRRRD